MAGVVRDANAMMEHLQKQAEAEKSMMTGAIIFGIVCAVVLVVLFLNHSSWRKYSMGRVSDEDSISVAIAKFRLNISNAVDVVNILDALRKKVHKSPEAAVEAAKGHLASHLLECVQDVAPTDEKVPIVITILNELWSVPAVRQFEHQHNSTEYLRVVDAMIELFKRLRAVDRAMEEDEREDQDESSSFFATKKITFATYEYKFIMALGMACIDSINMQSRIGDKGGIDCIIESLENSPDDKRIVKWSCWALVYLCISHPPNKRSLVQRGGIPLIIRGLGCFNDDEEVNYQGFAVLFSILADDPQTKISLSECRQMALAGGIVDLLQNCQKKFRENKGLQGLTASILDILVTEYS